MWVAYFVVNVKVMPLLFYMGNNYHTLLYKSHYKTGEKQGIA